MIPILYKSAEVDFTTNGLGLLNDIYSVDIQEQRNGLLTLTASYPTNAKHYKEIETGRIIYAKPNPLDGAQAFRIVKTELDISGYNLNIEADHITYDLTHNLVKEVHLQGDGQNAMTHLQNATVTPHLFRFVSDLQHLGDSRLQYVNPMEAIAGTEGSILQIWGGELHRDNRTVSMLSRRGRDNFTTFRLGKNINGLKYTVDMSNVTTRIVPTVTKSDATDKDKAYFVVGDTVDSKNLNKYPNVYIQHVDMGEKVTINEGETNEQIKAKIDKQAKNWFTQSANTGIDLPQVTVEIDVTSLQDSADYQEKFRNLESVGLTDTVSVYVPEFNVNVTAIVNELHYDPVAERVTSLVVGTSKKSFADNNSNALAELQNSITQIRQDATTAIVSSNGKNTNYYGTEEPAHPVEGDLWFKAVGDETYLMIFKDGRWQEWVSTKTQEEIAKKVDDAIQKANDYTDELNEKQASEAAAFQSEANAALSSAAAERNSLSIQADTMLDSANSHADSMANSAAAYGKAQAASALSSANSALSDAKSDLTTAIEQEISDRNQAVSAVNSQAQDYATQAKSDAIAAAKTADGQVRKDFEETTDSLSSTISQNKEDSDGKISTAQSTATQALNGLKTKVSQTDYNAKTGKLQTDLTTTSQTANQAKSDIVAIKSEADSQSAQINDIVSDAKGTKQTISDIQTEQGKQSGSIATLQSRADGFDATVTKVNNLAVGARNLFLGTKDFSGNGNWYINGNLIENVYQGLDAIQTAGAWGGPKYKNSALENQGVIQSVNDTFVMSALVRNTGTTPIRIFFYGKFVPTANKNIIVLPANSGWIRINTEPFQFSQTSGLTGSIRFEPTTDATDGYVQQVGLKLEKGNQATDWTPAPEDLESATAKAQLTADKANLDLSTYKTDADGRIRKAQSDITATSKEVKTKVSQSDYDKKTGDLSSNINTATQTANETKNELANVSKTVDSQSAKINTISNTVDGTTQTISDIKTEQGKQSGSITTLQSRADGFDATVTKVNNLSVGGRNLIKNGDIMYSWVGEHNVTTNDGALIYTQAPFAPAMYQIEVRAIDDSIIGADFGWQWGGELQGDTIKLTTDWQKASALLEFNKAIGLGVRGGLGLIELRFVKAEAGNIATDWTPAPEDVEGRVTALELDVNGITGTVNDPKKGLSATWDLASNGQTLAVQAQKDAKTADGKAVNAQKDATTAITTANGVQTTVTSVQEDVKDLQSTTTQTAGQVTTEIEDRKNGDKSVRTDMANLIDQRVKSVTDNYESAISQSADTIMASVSTPNQLLNTEFTPDLDGWTITNTGGTSRPYRSYIDKAIGSTSIGFNTVGDAASTYGSTVQQEISVSPGSNGIPISMRWDVRTVRNDYYTNLWLTFKDSTGAQLGRINKQWSYTTADNRWHEIKWENVALPDDTRSIKVSFEARENTTQYLARPMLVFGSTIGTYMPGSYSSMNTSTVLELFKDNWALGIANNAGRLISGINGDRSGTVIQGKKLVINSDTTINGKAFIDGSVIKNASIGTAQIGKAAVGSAQIINVDVSKISGNIANFITANINTLNSHVLYGDTGHLNTTDTGRVINKQDNHLQLASKGMYNSANDRAQVELLSHTNDIDANMRGSFNYYSDVRKGHGLGIRLVQNQILAIDEDGGSKMLYLSPYQGGEVRVVSRDKQAYYPMRASSFNTMSSRSAKSNIVPFEDCALDIVKKTKVRTYIKNNKQEIGVISDEADPRMLTDDDNAVSLYDYTSILYKAVQELSAQVEELQNERPNN